MAKDRDHIDGQKIGTVAELVEMPSSLAEAIAALDADQGKIQQ